MQWLPQFVRRCGTAGVLALTLLVVVVEVVQLTPAFLEATRGTQTHTGKEPLVVVDETLRWHLEQTQEQIKMLEAIKDQLKQNHNAQTQGLRILCTTQAKFQADRIECAKIQ